MNRIQLGLATSVLLLASQSAFAVPITATALLDSGINYNTTGIAGFATTGAMMSGMTIEVFFDDGSSDTGVWASTGSSSGGASGTGWSMSQSGTTFSNSFRLSNTSASMLSITRLVLDGRPGDTVFDYTRSIVQTPGSADGGNITDASGSPDVDGPAYLSVDGTYRNQVALNGTFFGDLYTVLDLTFGDVTGAPSGLKAGDRVSFTSDTDNTAIQGDITPAPAPSVLALLGLGLLGMTFARRKA